jgi:hypothetical protein
LTDAEISARSTKHAAWVAAGAAILAAILAFGVTWWSAEKAADSTAETVATQLSGETEKSRAEFLRGQRQVLYSTAITHERELYRAEFETDDAMGEAEVSRLFKRVLELKSKLDQDAATAEIIASEPVREQLRLLSLQHGKIRGIMQGGIESRYRGTESYNDARLKLNEERWKIVDAFYLAARKDMVSE